MDISGQCRKIAKDFEKRVSHQMAKEGYPKYKHTHYPVLRAMLDKDYVVTTTTIAMEIEETQQSSGKKIKELEKLGFVKKTLLNDDRRSWKVEITNKGFVFYECIIDCMDKASQHSDPELLTKLQWALDDFILYMNS